MAAIINQKITNAGGTFTFDASQLPDRTTINLYVEAGVTLAADVNIAFSNPPAPGSTVYVMQSMAAIGGVNLNGHSFYVNSIGIPQWMVTTPFIASIVGNPDGDDTTYFAFDFNAGGLDGGKILSGTTPLTALENLTSGHLIVGSVSNIPTSVAMSGDATISNAGVVTIANSAVTNAKVSASAGIARTKLASGTASYVLINNGSGVMSEESQLAPVRGGTGQDTSASTGFPVVASGTWSIGAMKFQETVAVSFEAAGGTAQSVGDFKIRMSGAGTITGIYAYATKAIAGTDNATIVAKNNAGTSMTGGTITFEANSPRGTAATATPSANNTFVDGDIITLTTAKTTAGGWALVTINYTRTA